MAYQYPTPISTAGSYDDAEGLHKRSKIDQEHEFLARSTSLDDEMKRLLLESSQTRDATGLGTPERSNNSSVTLLDCLAAEQELSVWGYMVSETNPSLSFLLSKESRCGKGKTRQEASYKPGKSARGITLKDYNGDNIASSGYLIGRSSECDVVISDSNLSQRHCVIFKINTQEKDVKVQGPMNVRQRVYLQDISGGGTFVNAAMVKQNEVRELNSDDQISLTEHGPIWVYRCPQSITHRSFEQRFRTGRTIGQGHFAEVQEVVEAATGQKFAAKIIKKKLLAKNESFLQEIGLLMACTHPLITCIRDVFETDTHIALVLELAAGGELFDRIIQKGHFTEQETKLIFRQLFSALSYLHAHNIVHRDIKPENILLTSANGLEIRLADFGLAKMIGHNSASSTLAGTPSYIPPEMLTSPQSGRSIPYTNKVDSWSAGVVLYICLCGFPPFSQELAPPSLKEQIKEGLYQFQQPYWDSVSDSAIDLVQRLLTVDPEQRYSITQAMQHPFLSSTSDEQKSDGPRSTNGRQGLKRQRTMISEIGRTKKSS